jgi:hypothetical protein
MLPIAMFLLQRDGQFLNGHDLFLKRVGSTYHAFLESAEGECRNKCLEDLQSTTRYVTWSLHTKSRASLKSMLNRVSTSCKAANGEVCQVECQASVSSAQRSAAEDLPGPSSAGQGSQPLLLSHDMLGQLNTTGARCPSMPAGRGNAELDLLQVTTPTQQQQALAKSGGGRSGSSVAAPEAENAVAEVLENTLWNRQLGVMSEEIVAALVCQIFEGGALRARAMA